MTSSSDRAPGGRSRSVATGISLAGIAGVAVAFLDQGASVAAQHSTAPTVTNDPGSATSIDPSVGSAGTGARTVAVPRTVTRAS
ncbi:MAG TPA: hypothetical protein VGN54_09540 [Mycobacteriales bacterium]|jgi:hypothetical protein|nr:hypothetical protein [Mycobacteriales bacterium]